MYFSVGHEHFSWRKQHGASTLQSAASQSNATATVKGDKLVVPPAVNPCTTGLPINLTSVSLIVTKTSPSTGVDEKLPPLQKSQHRPPCPCCTTLAAPQPF